MIMLKVGVDFYVSTDEVVIFQGYPSRPAQRDRQAAREAGLYKDATTGGKKPEKLRTLVHLRSGLIVGSALTPDALAKRPPIETPVKLTTRGNPTGGAHFENGAQGGTTLAPIESETHAPRGRSFASGTDNPNARPPQTEAEAEPEAELAPDLEAVERDGLFKRLLGRTDGPR